MHLVLLAALWGCAPEADSDHDGILDAEEAGFGTTVGDPDTDRDGLLDGEELEYGTHPLIADIDADRLTDGEEVLEAGTDPWAVDSDGDGYGDGDEIFAGTDPLDSEDGIYEGGWPYQRDKSAFGGPDLGDAVDEPGEPFARLQLLDQYGQEVDLYDFAGRGKPVVVEIAVPWCGGSLGLAQYVAGEDDPYHYGEYWPNIARLVDEGEIAWITIITESAHEPTPTVEDAEEWAEKAPHALMPFLVGNTDIERVYVNYSWPSVYFLDDQMRIVAGPDGSSEGFYAGLDAANDYGP